MADVGDEIRPQRLHAAQLPGQPVESLADLPEAHLGKIPDIQPVVQLPAADPLQRADDPVHGTLQGQMPPQGIHGAACPGQDQGAQQSLGRVAPDQGLIQLHPGAEKHDGDGGHQGDDQIERAEAADVEQHPLGGGPALHLITAL